VKRFKLGGDFLLLIHQLTYLPLPRRLQGREEDLPRAMRLLPLLGLFSGGAVYIAMRLFAVMPLTGAAAVLIGINLLAGGAFLLRDLMKVADGSSREPEPEPPPRPLRDERLPDNETEIAVKQRYFRVGRTGLVWGLVWLLGLYLIYIGFMRNPGYGQTAVVASAILNRLLMCWLIYYYAALPPALLHQGMDRNQFILSGVLALALILPFSRLALYTSFLVSFLGLHLFATLRVRSQGGLDAYCYGAACAWGEILFLLAWLALAHYL